MALQIANFQQTTIEKLSESLLKVWKTEKSQQPIVLKSPTGSGKTFMMAHFVRALNHVPAWDEDKCFIWITFSEELALQSRDKFEQYFGTSQENGLLTIDDFSQGKLKKNDILFLNWQKLVSKSAENRKLRRPEIEALKREQGSYFEDVIDRTKVEGRSIVLIIDEAHTNVTPDLAQDIIDYIAPRVVLHVSATPKPETVAKAADLGTYINVDRELVVQEGLIKEKIVIQTVEDLERHAGQDFDHVLLDLGLERREVLKKQFQSLGKNINPLLLIQIPNDDSNLVSLGEKTKEQVVVEYLESKGINPQRIGKWFDNHPKPDFIEDNDDEHDILIFKLAAGTGWDCPRAQVLVMFRNIKVEQRYIQTIGRILRTPDPRNVLDYAQIPELRAGYLFTNYHRQDIVDNWIDSKQSSPFVYTAKSRVNGEDLLLESDFLSRVDYGDLSSSSRFQKSFIESMNKYFDLLETDLIGVKNEKLEKHNLSLDGHITNQVVVNAEFADFDHLSLDFKNQGFEMNVEMSGNDVEKTFNLACWKLLQEQTEEDARVTNISRSWSPLKSAFRVWLRQSVGLNSDHYYRVVIADVLNGPKSSIRPALTQALKDYRPVLEEIVEERLKSVREKETYEFSIRESYSFPANYERLSTSLCALDSFYVPIQDYPGKKNETDFIEYLESAGSGIKWWFKQGTGREYFGIRYLNTSTNRPAIFYPDWIVRLQDGRLGIMDTKSGQTAKDTEGRAEALVSRLKKLGPEFFGGIVLKENGVWYINQSNDYAYTPGSLSKDWEHLENYFRK